MKIGILTQPLYVNYGGLVQCFALQKVLRDIGHEPVVLQREFLRCYTLRGAISYYAKLIVKLLLGRKESWHYYIDPKRRAYIAKYTDKFIEKNIPSRSAKCYTTEELKREVERLHLEAIVVGSDQVWRPFYSPCQPNYFLDFLGEDASIKRISYAASFGDDEWTFSEELTKQCGELLRMFKAVSVREKSAIALCKEHFGVEPLQVLDPTMLLEKEDYKKLIPASSKPNGLFCYVLNRNKEKDAIINHVAKATGLEPFETMPELELNNFNLYEDLEKCVYPPVEDWLASFRDAKMVVTDSFHGTVFSIIFNKPFWVVGNEGRGMARFNSLLSQYGMEKRLVTPDIIGTVDLFVPIDWSRVNVTREKLIEESKRFIIDSLH